MPENLELEKQLKLAKRTGSYLVGRREVLSGLKGSKLLVWSASCQSSAGDPGSEQRSFRACDKVRRKPGRIRARMRDSLPRVCNCGQESGRCRSLWVRKIRRLRCRIFGSQISYRGTKAEGAARQRLKRFPKRLKQNRRSNRRRRRKT